MSRRRSNVRQYSAEDQALTAISTEAENRLAAKRAARTEAREIRTKEIERQNKEAEEKERLGSDYGTTRARHQQNHSSRRGSNESSESTSDDKSRDAKKELRELEEKYKRAMVTSAQLDNEKQSLVYQVELLKDQLEEQAEAHTELQREYKEKHRDLELTKRELQASQSEVKALREQNDYKDRLITESGLVIVAAEDGELSLERSSESPSSNGSLGTGGILLSTESLSLLNKGREGSLGMHKLASSPAAHTTHTAASPHPAHPHSHSPTEEPQKDKPVENVSTEQASDASSVNKTEVRTSSENEDAIKGSEETQKDESVEEADTVSADQVLESSVDGPDVQKSSENSVTDEGSSAGLAREGERGAGVEGVDSLSGQPCVADSHSLTSQIDGNKAGEDIAEGGSDPHTQHVCNETESSKALASQNDDGSEGTEESTTDGMLAPTHDVKTDSSDHSGQKQSDQTQQSAQSDNNLDETDCGQDKMSAESIMSDNGRENVLAESSQSDAPSIVVTPCSHSQDEQTPVSEEEEEDGDEFFDAVSTPLPSPQDKGFEFEKASFDSVKASVEIEGITIGESSTDSSVSAVNTDLVQAEKVEEVGQGQEETRHIGDDKEQIGGKDDKGLVDNKENDDGNVKEDEKEEDYDREVEKDGKEIVSETEGGTGDDKEVMVEHGVEIKEDVESCEEFLEVDSQDETDMTSKDVEDDKVCDEDVENNDDRNVIDSHDEKVADIQKVQTESDEIKSDISKDFEDKDTGYEHSTKTEDPIKDTSGLESAKSCQKDQSHSTESDQVGSRLDTSTGNSDALTLQSKTDASLGGGASVETLEEREECTEDENVERVTDSVDDNVSKKEGETDTGEDKSLQQEDHTAEEQLHSHNSPELKETNAADVTLLEETNQNQDDVKVWTGNEDQEKPSEDEVPSGSDMVSVQEAEDKRIESSEVCENQSAVFSPDQAESERKICETESKLDQSGMAGTTVLVDMQHGETSEDDVKEQLAQTVESAVDVDKKVNVEKSADDYESKVNVEKSADDYESKVDVEKSADDHDSKVDVEKSADDHDSKVDVEKNTNSDDKKMNADKSADEIDRKVDAEHDVTHSEEHDDATKEAEEGSNDGVYDNKINQDTKEEETLEDELSDTLSPILNTRKSLIRESSDGGTSEDSEAKQNDDEYDFDDIDAVLDDGSPEPSKEKVEANPDSDMTDIASFGSKDSGLQESYQTREEDVVREDARSFGSRDSGLQDSVASKDIGAGDTASTLSRDSADDATSLHSQDGSGDKGAAPSEEGAVGGGAPEVKGSRESLDLEAKLDKLASQDASAKDSEAKEKHGHKKSKRFKMFKKIFK